MNNRKTTKRNRVKNRNWREAPFGYYKHDRGVGLGLPRKDSNPDIAGLSLRPVCFFYFKRIELLLFLSLTVTSNAITESSEKNRRTVQKSVIFTSKQLFCQSQKRSKKGKPFFPQQMLCNVRATKRLFTNN